MKHFFWTFFMCSTLISATYVCFNHYFNRFIMLVAFSDAPISCLNLIEPNWSNHFEIIVIFLRQVYRPNWKIRTVVLKMPIFPEFYVFWPWPWSKKKQNLWNHCINCVQIKSEIKETTHKRIRYIVTNFLIKGSAPIGQQT